MAARDIEIELEREREREKSAFKTARGFEVRSSITCKRAWAMLGFEQQQNTRPGP